MDASRAIDVKVGVKPVFMELIHSSAYEGPCRVGEKEALDPKQERRNAEEQFKKWGQQLKSELSEDARLLEPVKLEWKDNWHVPEAQIGRLGEDLEQVDLFLVQGGLSQYPAITIGHHFGKPIAMVGTVMTMDVAAYLRSRGLEGYAPLDFGQVNSLLSLLRARKALRSTRLLCALEGDVIPVGVVSTIADLEGLRDRLGVEHTTIPARALFDRMEALPKSAGREAEELTDELIGGAVESHMERDELLRSVKLYLATRRALEEFECNAFVMPCFELCSARIAERHRVTSCLTHSLLKDQGYPSACEGDVNVTMAMAVLMYLSGKTAYMGNTFCLDAQQNLISLTHDVAGLRMKGLAGPDLPYSIMPFTVGGWGATLRYDFSRDAGEAVTLIRFDPTARRLLLARGEITGGHGYDEIGCTLGVEMRVNDALDFFEKQQDFGHHMAMVYGDYVEDVRRLAALTGLEIVES